MNKKKILSTVALLTIAASSTIGMGTVHAVKGNVQNVDKCIYFAIESDELKKGENTLTSEKLKELLVNKGFSLKTELTGNVGTGTKINVEKDGKIYEYVVVLVGDANGDGKISNLDVATIRSYKNDSKNDLNVSDTSDPTKLAMDLNYDKKISNLDVATLRIYKNGIVEQSIPEEKLPETIEKTPLETAKEEAIEELSELYPQKNYFENDWETINAIISAFKNDLDALDTEAKVETFLEETKIELNKIETRQAKLTPIISNAKNDLDTLQSEYTDVDYDEDKLDVIATIITTAKEKLDNLDKDIAVEADVTKIVADATDEIALVKTKLDVKKEEAKADLDKYLVDNNINNENYNPDKLEQIVGLVNDGKMLIDKVSKTSNMNTALSDVSRTRDEIIDEIKVVPNKLKDLEDLKTAEIAEITNAIANDNYTDEQKLAIAGIKADAISKINEITDPELTEKVKEIANTALSELSKFRTPAQNAAIDAINAKYIKEKYYSEDWDKMVKEINKTKSEIEKALDSEIQSKLDALYAKLDGTDGYKTIEEQLLAKKTEALNDLKAKYFGNTNKKKYDTQTWNELQVEYNNQIQIINQQKTKTQVDLAWENALSVLGAYKTIAQNTEIVKNEALAELDKALTEYTNSENYSDDSLKALQDIVNAAKTKINKKGAKISAINAAKEEAITNMKAVPTIAQEALATCKEEAIKAIKSEYINNYANLINKEHAYEDAQVRILAPMYTPDNAINELTTIEEVNAKKDEMIKTMKAQPKAAELRLTRLLESYEANDYYNDDWANINKAFEESIKAIQESYKIAEINSAEETATNYISNNNIKTKDQVRQDTISAALAEISAKYAQYQDNQVIQDKINEIMSKANTDMTNAKTTYGVDGVLAIKDKAIKDIDDYIAGLQLSQE